MYPAHIKNERMQTVEEHCKNVADLASADASRIGLENTAHLSGLQHDVGKSTNQFAAYISDDSKQHHTKINHSSAGARFLSEHVHADNAVEKLTLELIEYAITSHHGAYDELSVSGSDALTDRIYPSYETGYEEAVSNSPWASAESFQDAVCEIQKILKKITKINNTDQRYVQLGLLQRYLCSCLKDGDWTDTEEFCKGKKQETPDNSKFLEQFLEQIEQQMEIYRSKENDGSEKMRAINRARMEMSDSCMRFAENGDGIYRLSMPTGGGKTDASMRYALHLAKKTGKDRIFYIAPFISIFYSLWVPCQVAPREGCGS